MILIDPNAVIASPFRPNAVTDPVTEYEFSTSVFVAENGKEQRHSRRARPRVTVSYECLITGSDNVLPLKTFLRGAGASAIAVPDFRLVGVAEVTPGSSTVTVLKNMCAWPVGTLILVQSQYGSGAQVSVVTSYDAAAGSVTISPGVSASSFIPGESVAIASAVACRPDEIEASFVTAEAMKVSVKSQTYPQISQFLGVSPEPLVFPMMHGDRSPLSFTSSVSVRLLGFDHGPILTFRGEEFARTGARTYDLESTQLTQSDKEEAIRFFVSCAGRRKSFTMPEGVIPDPTVPAARRYRFASDILSVTHIGADTSKISVKILELL